MVKKHELFTVSQVNAQSALARASGSQVLSGILDAKFSREALTACNKLIADETNREIANRKSVLVILIVNPAMPK